MLTLLFLAAADPLIGEWRGTSTCQVRPSPCHDEQAVYRIEPSGTGYVVHFAKLIDGKAQEFGSAIRSFDPQVGRLTVVDVAEAATSPGVSKFRAHI